MPNVDPTSCVVLARSSLNTRSNHRPIDDHIRPVFQARKHRRITLNSEKRVKVSVNDQSVQGCASSERDSSSYTDGKRLFEAAALIWSETSSELSNSEDEELMGDDTIACLTLSPPAKRESRRLRVGYNTEDGKTVTEEGDNDEDVARTQKGEDAKEEIEIDNKAPYKNRAIRQAKRSNDETLTPHPTDPNLILATFNYTHPNGRRMKQINSIPEIPLVLADDKKLTQEIWPEPISCKVPPRLRSKKGVAGALWVRDSTRDCWTRTSSTKDKTVVEEFHVQIVFRRCNPVTHVYISIYTNVDKLANADPNDKAWMYSYNKWIDQLNRRNNTSYTAQVPRDHWSAAELRALLTAINAYCHTKGIDQFGCKGASMKDADFQVIVDAVNAVGENGRRNVDAIRGQINTAHARKMPMIMELRDLAVEMRTFLKEKRGILSDAERRPLHAIPLSKFPPDPFAKVPQNKITDKSKTDIAAPRDPSNNPGNHSDSDSTQAWTSPTHHAMESKKRKRPLDVNNSSTEPRKYTGGNSEQFSNHPRPSKRSRIRSL
ncbi:hypothetical protein J1614_010265 [Plenodomus biglobosus]|nr:hypothetical protein J1614_010265 [Plenodomus biglobosus]